MPPRSHSLAVLLGVTLAGISGYLAYLLYKSSREDEDEYGAGDSLHVCGGAKQVLEVRVPKDLVRVIIGRNGKNIKEIQDSSKTRISFKSNDPEADNQICVIRGPADCCKLAENLLYEFIASQPKLESEIMFVPSSYVARIIGKGGERITQIRSMSGAIIKVVDNGDQLPNASTTSNSSRIQESSQRAILLKGTTEQIQIAKTCIENVVTETQEMEAALNATLAKREPRVPLASSRSPSVEAAAAAGESTATMNGTCAAVAAMQCSTERLSAAGGSNPGSQFEVYVSAMVDPTRFWLQIVGPKATKLDQLVEEMTDYYNKEENRTEHALTDVEQGKIVAAMFSVDNKWYRAEILELNAAEKSAELYYVDYGDTESISLNELFELRTDFLQLNFQAIECYLARVEPNGEVWSEDAKDRFEDLTQVAQWKKLSARVNGYQSREKTRAKREGSPVPGVDLYDVNNQKDIDIAQELVNQGYAIFKKTDALELRSSSSRNSTRSSDSMSPIYCE